MALLITGVTIGSTSRAAIFGEVIHFSVSEDLAVCSMGMGGKSNSVGCALMNSLSYAFVARYGNGLIKECLNYGV